MAEPSAEFELDEVEGVEREEPLPDPLRVVVADDHPMWRDAVARDLADAGFSVVGTAADGPAAVRRTLAAVPHVLVLDLNLPGLRGPQVCAELAAAGCPTRILILSVSGEHQDVLDAVKAGATGYLVKSAGRAEFLEAVRRTARGRAVFTPGLADLVLGEFRRLAENGSRARLNGRGEDTLTDRETEVLRLVATGRTYKEIAQELFISHRTVQNHVQNTLNKLQMHNRVELVRYALERGLDGPRTR
jgi:DNA-binding NarL/FixJ family response regulator